MVSICLACGGPWVWSPAQEKKRIRKVGEQTLEGKGKIILGIMRIKNYKKNHEHLNVNKTENLFEMNYPVRNEMPKLIKEPK